MSSPAARALHAEPIDDVRSQLGEGATWDGRGERLLHVDITGGRVHAWQPRERRRTTFELPGEVGAVLPREPGGLILAVDHDLLARDADGATRTLATVEQDRPDNRFNDCRCDPQGRLWAGTMSRSRVPGTAALYRLAPGGLIEQAIAGTTISNGLGWSPDGERMYFIDSVEQRIDVLDFDGVDGAISGRRPFARIDPDDGLPDGLCVDAEGGVWIALFGGGAIRRYGADGALDAHVPLPVTHPTCPAFGGPGLRTLYVTSTRHRLTPEQLAREPLAGAVLALEPGVAGLPAARFAG